ncbi:MAG TPA: hypothetical protein VHD38_03180 [Candidatus Paceibacterota bacterium]|nr:hypothetical protein [Candidatus Paceibacterota bacterium]
MLDIRLTRNRSRAVALVDLNQSAVSVAICRIEDDHALLAASAYSALSLDGASKDKGTAQLASRVKEAGQKVTHAYSGPPIEAVYVIVHAPFISSRTMVAETHSDSQERIYDASIANMAREALGKEQLDRAKLVEGSVVRIELNGFPTQEPAGKWASQVRIISLLSECDPEIRRLVEGEVNVLFPAGTVLWRSAIRACAAYGRSVDKLGEEYSILDMGATVSQVISVRSGEIESHMIDTGTSSILQKIAGGMSAEEALGALRMIESGAASSESVDALQKRMALAEPDLVKTLADSISQIAAERRISNSLLLLTHRDLEPWLTRVLSRIDFSQFTVTTLPFEIRTPQHANDTDAALAVNIALVNSELSSAA